MCPRRQKQNKREEIKNSRLKLRTNNESVDIVAAQERHKHQMVRRADKKNHSVDTRIRLMESNSHHHDVTAVNTSDLKIDEGHSSDYQQKQHSTQF